MQTALFFFRQGRDYLIKSVSTWLPSRQKEEESSTSAEQPDEDEEEEERLQVCVWVRMSMMLSLMKDPLCVINCEISTKITAAKILFHSITLVLSL